MAGIEREIRKGLVYYRDGVAVRRAVQQGSLAPVGRRVLRRLYGKATGRLAGKLFG